MLVNTAAAASEATARGVPHFRHLSLGCIVRRSGSAAVPRVGALVAGMIETSLRMLFWYQVKALRGPNYTWLDLSLEKMLYHPDGVAVSSVAVNISSFANMLTVSTVGANVSSFAKVPTGQAFGRAG